MLMTHGHTPPINMNHTPVLRKHDQGPKKTSTLTYAEHHAFNIEMEDRAKVQGLL